MRRWQKRIHTNRRTIWAIVGEDGGKTLTLHITWLVLARRHTCWLYFAKVLIRNNCLLLKHTTLFSSTILNYFVHSLCDKSESSRQIRSAKSWEYKKLVLFMVRVSESFIYILLQITVAITGSTTNPRLSLLCCEEQSIVRIWSITS